MLRRTRRLFAQLPDKKEVQRPLTDAEHTVIDLKNDFGRSGIFRNRTMPEAALYKVWSKAKAGSYDDFAAGCYGMNMFYNFGRRMKCKQMTDRFLQLCIKTEQYDQGIETLKYYKGWMEHPPTRKTTYELLNRLKEKKEWMKVREGVAAVRENWQMVPTANLYKFGIEAMLQLEERSAQEALKIYDDSLVLKV
jgi:hypothetical protein